MKIFKFGDKVESDEVLIKQGLEYFDTPESLSKKLDENGLCEFVQSTYEVADCGILGIVVGKVTLNTRLSLYYEEDDNRGSWVRGVRDMPIKVLKVAYGINRLALVPIESARIAKESK